MCHVRYFSYLCNIKINSMKLIEFTERFDSEESCENYLKEIREKEGVVCAKCGSRKHYWDKASKSWRCAKCGHETTLTSGTVMHGSKLPLRYWFLAMHLMTSTKKTISAAEMQRQIGHKRYQPIWEMMHKLRSVMGKRDEKYKLAGILELDEGYFSIANPLKEEEELKCGIGSQKKAKVLVMVESEKADEPKAGGKSRKCGHIKMQVISDLKADTFEREARAAVEEGSTVVMDNLRSHVGVERVVERSERQTVLGKDAPKVLPWVHIAIANAKSLLQDMYHGIKGEFLQSYLDEFCYKFNRKYFGDRVFDRLVVAGAVSRPTFEHRLYNKNISDTCG